MKKIAIVRRNGLGDLLCAFPLVKYFQKYEPGSHITLFVDSRNAPLIRYLPPVDRVIELTERGNKYLSLWRTARALREEFDLALSAKTSPMKLMNFFLYALRAKKRIAYVDGCWHSRFINAPVLHDPKKAIGMHQALKGLKLVEPSWERVPEELYPTLHVPAVEKPFALPGPTVLVSATTTGAASRLNTARYASILNRLHAMHPISVVVIGQKADTARAFAIASGLKCPHLVHFPRTFEEFMLFLNATEFYFVGDGGVAHIGAALGKRGLVLYGSTNHIEWAPLSKKMETLFHPIHVDHLDEEMILEELKRNIGCGRENRECSMGHYSS